MFERLERSEAILIVVMALFAFTGVAGVVLYDSPSVDVKLDPVPAVLGAPGPVEAPTLDAPGWFAAVRPHCNPVEVDTYMNWQPPPPSPDGDMYKAACYALAGRIAHAREAIESLPRGLHRHAVGVVFDAGHPAADAGDDVAAGPLMELVVEYWPNHYMALYHAGAARFELGDHDLAGDYLERFLAAYAPDDMWSQRAHSMLERMREL